MTLRDSRDTMEAMLKCEGVLGQHFPYVTRGPEGEFIIPGVRINDFVVKYLELADKQDHLEHLKYYRSQGARAKPSEIDD